MAPSEFLAWLAELPWVALPEDLVTRGEIEAAGTARAVPGAVVPAPAVAVSLAAHAAAGSSVVLRLRGPDAEVHVIVSLLAGLAAGLARSVHRSDDPAPGVGSVSGAGSEPGTGSEPGVPAPGWVEVSLLPAAGAVAELMRWVPVAEAGPVVAAATLEVAVVAADDAVWRWFEAWQRIGDGWRRVPPEGAAGPGAEGAGPPVPLVPPAAMRTELERSLHRVLARDGAGRG